MGYAALRIGHAILRGLCYLTCGLSYLTHGVYYITRGLHYLTHGTLKAGAFSFWRQLDQPRRAPQRHRQPGENPYTLNPEL